MINWLRVPRSLPRGKNAGIVPVPEKKEDAGIFIPAPSVKSCMWELATTKIATAAAASATATAASATTAAAAAATTAAVIA